MASAATVAGTFTRNFPVGLVLLPENPPHRFITQFAPVPQVPAAAEGDGGRREEVERAGFRCWSGNGSPGRIVSGRDGETGKRARLRTVYLYGLRVRIPLPPPETNS